MRTLINRLFGLTRTRDFDAAGGGRRWEAPDVTLLQNTLAALRITGNKEAASRLVTNHLDLLLSDNQAKQAVGAFALDIRDDDLLARVLATDFDGSAILRLESALRDSDWRRAREVCEIHPEEISHSGRIDSAFARDLLDAMLEGEARQSAAFQAIFNREGPSRAENDLFLAQMASKAGLDELSAAAFDRAISSGAGSDAELRRALAGEAMDRDMPDLVVDLLEEHVDPSRDDLSRRWLAISYARSDVPRQSGVAFFAAVRRPDHRRAPCRPQPRHLNVRRCARRTGPFPKRDPMTKTQPALPAWTQHLRPGTILLFRFPERHDDLAGKRRPCLVLGTRQQKDGLQVALAYGTSVDSSANRGFDISVEADDCASVGTHRPTRFVLARRIAVAADDPRFDIGTEDNPIVGQLLDDQMGQLRALAGFLGDRVFEDAIPRPRRKPPFRRHRDQPEQALARTVSDRREITTPMRRSRGAGSTARTVIVEHRRKRGKRPLPSAA